MSQQDDNASDEPLSWPPFWNGRFNFFLAEFRQDRAGSLWFAQLSRRPEGCGAVWQCRPDIFRAFRRLADEVLEIRWLVPDRLLPGDPGDIVFFGPMWNAWDNIGLFDSMLKMLRLPEKYSDVTELFGFLKGNTLGTIVMVIAARNEGPPEAVPSLQATIAMVKGLGAFPGKPRSRDDGGPSEGSR